MTDTTQYDRMLRGEVHIANDPHLFSLQMACIAQKAKVDATGQFDMETRQPALAELFGSMTGPAVIVPPFHIEFGKHVHLGAWVYINAGCTMLDSNEIHIGDRVAIGPNVQLLTGGHPLRPEDRYEEKPGQVPPFDVMNVAHPIRIGSYVWIGAGAIILPGVTIGDGAMVAAGAVVNRDVPARMVVAGNPARVVKSVDD